MMKKITIFIMVKKMAIFILIIVIILSLKIDFVQALEGTPSVTSRNQQIKELKEKIATKVAELKILAPKVLLGEIKTLSDQKIIITVQETDVNIELSDDTSFSYVSEDGNKKDIKVGQLKVGQKIIVWGTFNKEAQTMTATGVVARDLAKVLTGQIASIDKKNYQFTVSDKSGVLPYTFDINPPTKINILGDDNKLTKIGFSKLAVGQTVYIYGFVGEKTDNKTLLSAKRIIVLSSPAPTPSPTPTISPTPEKKAK